MKKEKVAKDDTFSNGGVVGHWKRNYHKYFVGLKGKMVVEGTTCISIFMIEMSPKAIEWCQPIIIPHETPFGSFFLA